MSNKKLPANLHRDTLAVRAAEDKSQFGENSEALYLTSSFVQPDAETARRRFAGEEDGYMYSRFTNPTVTSMERRLAALDGTEACIGTSSGMAAIMLMCMGLLKAGDTTQIDSPLPVRVVVGRAQSVSVTLRGEAFDLKPHTQVTVARFEVKE
jgi:O-acetylhomoserine/O-acetylserine sulfhydrylase-like pyridoxal-dependent enzyme